MPDYRTNIVGIKIVYCTAGGEAPREIWVDLDQVRALAWADDRVGERPKPNGPIPKNRLPQAKGPGDCPQTLAQETTPLCWWNGNTWVCGEE